MGDKDAAVTWDADAGDKAAAYGIRADWVADDDPGPVVAVAAAVAAAVADENAAAYERAATDCDADTDADTDADADAGDNAAAKTDAVD